MLESIKKKNAINFVEIEPNTDNDSYIDKRLIEDDEDDTSFNKELSNENDEKSKEISENQRNIITNIIGTLSDRERDIIENYYGLNSNKELTLSEIGKKYNLSSERVRQIKLVSLRKLRSKILLYDDLEDLFV
jgi:RNA polymerase primary sigma factor